MQLLKLFEMQKALDGHIEEKHDLGNEDLFSRKVLALLVEIGELANETRCFKFWSLKEASPKPVILEEYVDGIHFILSLGIECGFHQESFDLSLTGSTEDVTGQFLTVYENIHRFTSSKSLSDYSLVFQSYLELGALLGITDDELEQAYFEKNEVNYQRQQNNY